LGRHTFEHLKTFWRSSKPEDRSSLISNPGDTGKTPASPGIAENCLEIENIKTINIKLSESAPSMHSSQTVNLESITIIAKGRYSKIGKKRWVFEICRLL
jgi:hypothetical protein